MDDQNKNEGVGLYQNPQAGVPPQNTGLQSQSVFVPPAAQDLPPSPPPPPPPVEEESFFSKVFSGKILKTGLAILLVVILLFIVFRFVLPNFGKDKNETVTLTYWGLWEDSKAMQVIISDFERQNPKIKID